MKVYLSEILVVMSVEVISGFLLSDFFHRDKDQDTTRAPDTAHSQKDCNGFPEYHAVRNIPTHSPCTSETQVWVPLDKLRRKSIYCMNLALHQLRAYTAHHHTKCSCPGKFRKKGPHGVSGHEDHPQECFSSPGCIALADRYYHLNAFSGPEDVKCQSHAHVWPMLAKVGVEDGVDTRDEIILHLGIDFGGSHSGDCKCTAIEPTTPKPTTTTTTTTTPRPTTTTTKPTTTTTKPTTTTTKPTTTTTKPTTTTTKPTTTTTKPTTTKPTTTTTKPTTEAPVHIGSAKCHSYKTVTDLANHHISQSPQAIPCLSGNRTSPEAFVLDHCTVQTPAQWTRGANVMKYCSRIPLYMPVATFVNQQYVSSGGLSGIFLGCIDNGFKLGVQRCDTIPDIDRIERGGLFTKDPDLYFIVE